MATNQDGNSIAIGTRVRREVYNELETRINGHNATVSSVASFAIELGLHVMRRFDGDIEAVAHELQKLFENQNATS